jgi:hypothetical protein
LWIDCASNLLGNRTARLSSRITGARQPAS